MTHQQHLLMKIAEEAAEVAQRALKAAFFGVHEIQKDRADDNNTRLMRELADLEAVVDMAEGAATLHRPTDQVWAQWKAEKVAKVLDFLAYAQYLGQVEP